MRDRQAAPVERSTTFEASESRVWNAANELSGTRGQPSGTRGQPITSRPKEGLLTFILTNKALGKSLPSMLRKLQIHTQARCTTS